MIELRKWQLSDKYDLAEAVNNHKVQDNLRDGLPYPYTPDDAQWYINEMQKSDSNDTFPFAITLDGKVIGSISVFRGQNIHQRTGELGYYIGEPYWNNGYMTEAVRQICEYVFSNSDIIRIYAEPFANNIGSCRVLEKSGFQYEGVLHANAVKNGKVLDMKMYGLIKDSNENSNNE